MTAKYKTSARLLQVILICLIFQGCNFNGPNFSGTWINDRIDKEKREEINILNKKFFLGFKNNDPSAIRSIMADSLVQIMGSRLDSMSIQAQPYFQKEGFSVLNEYNIKNTTTLAANSIPGSDLHDNKYNIVYTALNKEMYVSLFLVKYNSNSELLVTAIYGNYNGKWKLNIFHIGQYRFYNKTAMDYYQKARKDVDRSDLADAVCDLTMADALIHPAEQIFQYDKEAEYKMFFDSVSNEVKSRYHFPFTLDRVPGKPKVFSIQPQMLIDGYFPLVLYLSNINVKDTVLLKGEYEKVKTEVKHEFTGISTGKKYTLYRVFNEIPDGSHLVPNFTFVDQQ